MSMGNRAASVPVLRVRRARFRCRGPTFERDRSVGERKICGMCLVDARSIRAVRLTMTLWLAQPTRRCQYGPRLIAPEMTPSLSREQQSPFPGDSLDPWVWGSKPAHDVQMLVG